MKSNFPILQLEKLRLKKTQPRSEGQGYFLFLVTALLKYNSHTYSSHMKVRNSTGFKYIRGVVRPSSQLSLEHFHLNVIWLLFPIPFSPVLGTTSLLSQFMDLLILNI